MIEFIIHECDTENYVRLYNGCFGETFELVCLTQATVFTDYDQAYLILTAVAGVSGGHWTLENNGGSTEQPDPDHKPVIAKPFSPMDIEGLLYWEVGGIVLFPNVRNN